MLLLYEGCRVLEAELFLSDQNLVRNVNDFLLVPYVDWYLLPSILPSEKYIFLELSTVLKPLNKIQKNLSIIDYSD